MSWHSDMGIFHMFENLKQFDDSTQIQLYRMPHVISLEMHPSHETGLNYMTIGGYNKDIVKNEKDIKWY